MLNKKLFIPIFIIAGLYGCNLSDDLIQINKTIPTKPVITVALDKEQKNALAKELSYETGTKILAVHMIREKQPAKNTLLGKYQMENNLLSFTPQHHLGEGLEFEIQYYSEDDTVKKLFSIPSSPKPNLPPPEVEQIFPLTNKIPANILIFHIRFNQQMQDDFLAFGNVKIIDSKGEEKQMAWRQKSHWLDSNQVLVMMIHPGRVKRGIDYKKEELGDLFTIGETYTLQVTSELKNRYRQQLLKMYSKTFTIVAADREIPGIRFDKFQLPKVNTMDPLTLVFSEGMDYSSINEEVDLFDSKSKETIPGSIIYTDYDSIFQFLPKQPWEKRAYEVQFGKKVADFAHNRLDYPFEIQNLDELPSDTTPRKWEFSPK